MRELAGRGDRKARSRVAPERFVYLVMVAPVASVCIFATGTSRRDPPQACPHSSTNPTVACEGCIKRSCRFDDSCLLAKNLQSRRTVACIFRVHLSQGEDTQRNGRAGAASPAPI